MIEAGERVSAALWQDVECGGYTADLPRLTELALAADGPVVELGAGSGRVALALARAGARVIAVERDRAIASELAERARAARLDGRLRVVATEAAGAELEPGSIALVLAPMQFLHLLPAAQRGAVIDRVRVWLRAGGRFAAVVLADPPAAISGEPETAPPLPDVREVGGWVLSSVPRAIRPGERRIEVERLRQAVSPAGELSESLSVDVLWELGADELVAEATGRGLAELAREALPGDELHVDSTLVLLERA